MSLPFNDTNPSPGDTEAVLLAKIAQATSSAGGGGPPGTVTSVNITGGTTGLSFSGGPVTTAGTITAAGTLVIANGGTGKTTAANAVDALGGAASTGTGGLVRATSPTLTTPIFSGTATGSISGNAATVTTNANLTGPITSVGNATSIASQTGTGSNFVVDTSPTLVTPNIGVATATSVNKLILTAPATSATFTLTNGKTLAVTNTLTFSGTDSTVMTFPSSSATVAGLGIVQTFSANCTFSATTSIAALTLTGSGAIDFNARAISNFVSTVNAQTGTTYTVVAADAGKIVTCSNASAITVTVSTSLPDGGSVTIAQKGAGQVTISPSGLTIRNRSSFTKTAGQYAAVTLLRDGTDLYLTGDGA